MDARDDRTDTMLRMEDAMNTMMIRSLAYPPLLTRARRALAALFIGALIALVAGCDAGALVAAA